MRLKVSLHIPILLFLVSLSLYLFSCFITYRVGSDSLSYHLSFPHQFHLDSTFFNQQLNLLWLSPNLSDRFFLLLPTFDSRHLISTLVSFLLFPLAFVAIYLSLPSRLARVDTIFYLAFFSIFSFPFLYTFGTSYVEPYLFLFVLISTLSFLFFASSLSFLSSRRFYLHFFSLLHGCSLSFFVLTKITTFFSLPLVLFVQILLIRSRGHTFADLKSRRFYIFFLLSFLTFFTSLITYLHFFDDSFRYLTSLFDPESIFYQSKQSILQHVAIHKSDFQRSPIGYVYYIFSLFFWPFSLRFPFYISFYPQVISLIIPLFALFIRNKGIKVFYTNRTNITLIVFLASLFFLSTFPVFINAPHNPRYFIVPITFLYLGVLSIYFESLICFYSRFYYFLISCATLSFIFLSYLNIFGLNFPSSSRNSHDYKSIRSYFEKIFPNTNGIRIIDFTGTYSSFTPAPTFYPSPYWQLGLNFGNPSKSTLDLSTFTHILYYSDTKASHQPLTLPTTKDTVLTNFSNLYNHLLYSSSPIYYIPVQKTNSQFFRSKIRNSYLVVARIDSSFRSDCFLKSSCSFLK